MTVRRTKNVDERPLAAGAR